MNDGRYRWYRELNGYQWFVLIVAALGWMLDCFDQQLFMMARQPAMAELLPDGSSLATINKRGGYAVSVFLMGWGIGGLIFGVMGDRIGRAKTMMITILMYSVFTGLSAASTSFWLAGSGLRSISTRPASRSAFRCSASRVQSLLTLVGL